MYAAELSNVMASGLAILNLVDTKLLELYRRARDVTVALDQYHRGADGAPSVPDLLDARNRVQHGFLSLQVRTEQETDPLAAVFEICWIAGLIFSDMVILPLPYKSGVKPRLSHHLRLVVEASSLTRLGDLATSSELRQLLTWALLLGTIAATLTGDYDWYLQKFQESVGDLKLDWFGFRRVMRTFLWWDFVFEVPAASIWKRLHSSSNASGG